MKIHYFFLPPAIQLSSDIYRKQCDVKTFLSECIFFYLNFSIFCKSVVCVGKNHFVDNGNCFSAHIFLNFVCYNLVRKKDVEKRSNDLENIFF